MSPLFAVLALSSKLFALHELLGNDEGGSSPELCDSRFEVLGLLWECSVYVDHFDTALQKKSSSPEAMSFKSFLQESTFLGS